MIRYWKEKSTYDPQDFTPTDDSYINLPFRKRGHTQHSTRMMEKRMQKYFDKTEEALLNKQMTDKWRNLKSTFDSYMNLTPYERRRTSVANMRGYQIDPSRKVLYSFEDNCVYDINISDAYFNKIIVKTVNHTFTDMEKRTIFDNPYSYQPVSPYRIHWPSVGVKGTGELALAAIEKSLTSVADATRDFTDTMNQTMVNFTSSVNNITAQNAVIQQDFSKLLDKRFSEPRIAEGNQETQEPNPTKRYLDEYGKDTVYYRDDGHKPTGATDEKLRHFTRGSKQYRQKIDTQGWIDDGHYIWNPALEQPLTVNNTIQQNFNDGEALAARSAAELSTTTRDLSDRLAKLTPVIKQLSDTIAQMTPFDISANMTQLYTVITETAAEIRKAALSKDNAQCLALLQESNTKAMNETLTQVLDMMKEKLDSANYDSILSEMSQKYQDLVKSIKDCEEGWGNKVMDICNALNAMIEKTEEQMQRVVKTARPNEETLVPSIQSEATGVITSISDLFNSLNAQYSSYLQQIQQLNTQLTAIVPNGIAQQLNTINTSINNSRAFYQNLLNAMQSQIIGSIQENTLATQGVTQQLENLQNDMNNGIATLDNTIGQNNLLTNMQTVMLQQIGVNTERMLAQQQYNNWLIENGFNYVAEQQNKVYEAYKQLSNRPVTPKYLLSDEEKIQQNNLLQSMSDTVKVEVLEDANQVVPAVAYGNYAAQSAAAETIDTESLEQIRDQYVFFMDIMMNYIFDADFQSFVQRIGFVKMFNAYLKRNQNTEIFNLFIQLANRVHVTEEMYQQMEQAFNSIPCDIDVSLNDLLSKTASSIQNMLNSEN